MPLPSAPQDSHAIMAAVLIITGLCVVYWRLAFRLAVIITVGFAAYGLITALHA